MDTDNTPLYEIIRTPPVEGLPLILHSIGWIDCGDTVGRVVETIRLQSELEVLARFDVNRLVDHRSRRPELTLTDGSSTDLQWPEIELLSGVTPDGQGFMLLDGPEPDYNWRPFIADLAALVEHFGCSRIYTIGAYPAPVPHTRDVEVSHTASSPELVADRKVSKGSLTFPVGASVAIAHSLAAEGFEWLGYWSQVPYYAASQSWPQASLSLLAALERDAGLTFNLEALSNAAKEAAFALDAVVAEHEFLPQILPQLEHRYDEMAELESTIESADDFEAALRQLLDEDNT